MHEKCKKGCNMLEIILLVLVYRKLKLLSFLMDSVLKKEIRNSKLLNMLIVIVILRNNR